MKQITSFLFCLLIFSSCTIKVVRIERIYPNVADTYISKDFDQSKVYKIAVLPVINEGSPDDSQSIYSAKLLQQVLYAIDNFKVVDVNIVNNELVGINKSDYLKKSTIAKLSKALGVDLVLFTVYKYKYQPEQSVEASNSAYNGMAINNVGSIGAAARKDSASKGAEYIMVGGAFTFYNVKDMSPVIEMTTKNQGLAGSLSETFKSQILIELDMLRKGESKIRRDRTSVTITENLE